MQLSILIQLTVSPTSFWTAVDFFSFWRQRLQETVNTSRQETSLLLNVDDEEDYHQSPVPVITKICSILSKNLAEPIKTKHKSLSEQCIFTKFQEQESRLYYQIKLTVDVLCLHY